MVGERCIAFFQLGKASKQNHKYTSAIQTSQTSHIEEEASKICTEFLACFETRYKFGTDTDHRFRLVVLNVNEMPLTIKASQQAQFKPNARPVLEKITMKCIKQTQTHCAISTLPQLAAACKADQPSLSRTSNRAP